MTKSSMKLNRVYSVNLPHPFICKLCLYMPSANTPWRRALRTTPFTTLPVVAWKFRAKNNAKYLAEIIAYLFQSSVVWIRSVQGCGYFTDYRHHLSCIAAEAGPIILVLQMMFLHRCLQLFSPSSPSLPSSNFQKMSTPLYTLIPLTGCNLKMIRQESLAGALLQNVKILN